MYHFFVTSRKSVGWNESFEFLETFTLVFVSVKELQYLVQYLLGLEFSLCSLFLGVVLMFKLFVCMYFCKGIRVDVLLFFLSFQTS